jgi:hypothetical protein
MDRDKRGEEFLKVWQKFQNKIHGKSENFLQKAAPKINVL